MERSRPELRTWKARISATGNVVFDVEISIEMSIEISIEMSIEISIEMSIEIYIENML